MSKYSKSQLTELAKGVFQSSPSMEVVYASSNGTFLNQGQFDRLNAAQKKDFETIKNPAFRKEEEAEDKGGEGSTSEPNDKMTIAQLREYAEKNGIELAPEDKTKAQILEKIQAAKE